MNGLIAELNCDTKIREINAIAINKALDKNSCVSACSSCFPRACYI